MPEAKALAEVLRPFFDAHSARLDAALQTALAQPIELEPGRYLQFEICPFFYRVTITATEEDILPDDWLDGAVVAEQVEAIGGSSPEAETEFLVKWLADAWARVGGAKACRPAFAFYHGYHDGQFDLNERRWKPASEVFGE
ncbi:hypothetical protein [Limnoglobus roseus]|uniref:Uncharacterized protein n=1 Tax=Limnoglobus roseus TaxID=2598579 RepID=A0A5C1A603_9BACT|nr:hypothetical protein [Limnoglobus roseus]QEL13262.1 hypothetical protein PX52LOC_00116 [Limnoglobus roseus]